MASPSIENIITSSLLAHLETGETATVILKMFQGTKEVLDNVAANTTETDEDRGTAVASSLQALAQESQKPVLEFLDSQDTPVKYESMWINNSVVIHEADLKLVRALGQIPGVKEIREEKIVTVMASGTAPAPQFMAFKSLVPKPARHQAEAPQQ